MLKMRSDGLTFDQVHYIRTSDLHTGTLAEQLGFNVCSVRRARHGVTWTDHPTPPTRGPRAGWKKDGLPCEFKSAAFSLIGEIWRPVVGWERYYRVSNLGRLYSLHQTGRLVVGMPMEGGYRVLKVRDKGRRAHIATHVMVLEAFVGPRPSPAHEGCHNDGDGSNSCLSNLRWDTAKGNQADRLKHGTDSRGERCTAAKLTPEAVREIRTQKDVSDKEWAGRFGICVGAVKAARLRKTWRNVPTPALERPGAEFQKKRGTKVGTHGAYTVLRVRVNGKPTLKYVR